jgi:hypothetical protein
MNQEKYIGYIEIDTADLFDVVTHLSCLLGGKVFVLTNACLSPQGQNAILSPTCLCPSAVLPTAYTTSGLDPLQGRFFIMH